MSAAEVCGGGPGSCYAVVCAQDGSPGAVAAAVGEMMLRGWRPVGGLAVARAEGRPVWAQAMARGVITPKDFSAPEARAEGQPTAGRNADCHKDKP